MSAFTPGRLIVTLCLAFYIFLIDSKVSPFIGGSDSSGYYNNARLLSDAAIYTEPRVVEGAEPGRTAATMGTYLPLGFRTHATEMKMVPSYPIGLSLLTLVTATFTGWPDAPAWVAGWNMLLGVLLCFAVGRQCGLPPAWSWLGAFILASSPLYLAMGLQPMSDVPALTWCSGAIFFAMLARKNARWWTASGFCVAVAVLIRPTNVLIALPLMVLLGLQLRCWIWFGLGGLPGAVTLAIYNYLAYGAVLTTGYGDMREGFSAEWILPTTVFYLRWLPLLFTPFVLLALGLPWTGREKRQHALVLIVWAATFLAFYTSYYFTHIVWWYLRFVLPAMPPLIIGALLVIRHWLQKRGWDLFSTANLRVQIVSGLLVAAVAIFNITYVRKLEALYVKRNDRSYFKTADWLNRNAPVNAVITTMQSSGSLFAYTDFVIVRWDNLTPEARELLDRRLEESRRPLYAVLYPFEEKDAFAHWPGRWREVFRYGHAGIWLRESGQP